MDNFRIIIAGGGTGGHLFPAIAIGEEIKERFPKDEIHFIGSDFGLEAKVFPVKDLLHTLKKLGIGCIAFSPLAQGMLSGKYLKSIPKVSRISDNSSLDK